MRIAQHMDIIFIAAFALVSASAIASATIPAQRMAHSAMRDGQAVGRDVAGAPMAVVTISAKRLSAAQKAALGN